MKLVGAAALIVMCATAAYAASGTGREPSELEMRQAFQRRLDNALSSQAAQGQQGCSAMNRGSQNPMDAIACGIIGGQIGNAARQISISYFEKLGCQKAVASGYTCDYLINANAPNFGAFNPGNGRPVSGTKRFILSNSGWIALDR